MRDHILKNKNFLPTTIFYAPLVDICLYSLSTYSHQSVPLQHNFIRILSPYYIKTTLKKQSVTFITYMPANPVARNQPVTLHHLYISVGCQTLVHHHVPNLIESIPDSATSFIWPLSLVFVR